MFGKRYSGPMEIWEPGTPETDATQYSIAKCYWQHRSCPNQPGTDKQLEINSITSNDSFHSTNPQTQPDTAFQKYQSPRLTQDTQTSNFTEASTIVAVASNRLSSNSPYLDFTEKLKLPENILNNKRQYNFKHRLRSRNYWQSRRISRSNIISSVINNDPCDKRPYAQVTVNGLVYNGLLDSGATISILGVGSDKYLNDPSIKFHSFPSVVNTASGQPQRIFEFINAYIKFNNEEKRMRLYLVPTLEQPLYLGIDFWNLFGITPKIATMTSVPTDDNDQFHKLPPEELATVKEIILQFPSFTQMGLGKTNLITHIIDVGLAKPIKQRFYAISPAVQDRMYAELDRMISLGVIEESQSSWCSPVTLVSKANGKVRLCLDARELNKVTVKDAYPLPLIDGLLGRLDQTRFISSIDLKDAFWQIPLDPQSRDKTAFTVPGRPLYQFTVMPFGLCNAPQTMCRLMHRVIPHQLHDRVFVYLDDLLITSATLGEHFALLRQVASLLRKSGLTINVEKSRFLLKEVRYLGYVVGDGCLRTNIEKVEAIVDYPVPKTTKQVQRFTGMCGWYRRVIRNFAFIASPLTDLTKKGSKVKWSEMADKSFNLLKESLTSAPVLVNPDFKKPFLHTV